MCARCSEVVNVVPKVPSLMGLRKCQSSLLSALRNGAMACAGDGRYRAPTSPAPGKRFLGTIQVSTIQLSEVSGRYRHQIPVMML